MLPGRHIIQHEQAVFIGRSTPVKVLQNDVGIQDGFTGTGIVNKPPYGTLLRKRGQLKQEKHDDCQLPYTAVQAVICKHKPAF